MMNRYNTGKNFFEKLNETFGINNPVDDYLNEYRYHKPDINLSTDARNALDLSKGEGIELGLISDGRLGTQMNWNTVCLIDSTGANIHTQQWNVPSINLPKYEISSLMDLVKLI